MIPLYGVSQVGGKIVSLDDPVTVNDLAAANGTGGTAFTPFVLSTPFRLKRTLGYYDFRKLRQRADCASDVTLAITPWRDGQDTGQTIIRMFPVSAVDVTSTPLWVTGSDFQVKVAVSGYTRPVELGNASASFVPKRHSRGTGVGNNPALPVSASNFLYIAVQTYNGHSKYNGVLIP